MRIKGIIMAAAVAATLTLAPQLTRAQTLTNFCPGSGGLANSWWSFTPSNRMCSTSYYTWNTTTTEESYYHSGPHYMACGYYWWQDPGYTNVRVYIPSPDAKQTSNARYYKWNTNNYVMIGSVNQYNTFGYAWLNTIDWDPFDELKLSDRTMGEALYSKHVDLDSFSFTCPN